ncbi:3TM-type holin [Pseudohongiella acticola]|uniref:3TM-type holin n=1 Tax=Pseudohongiella acticola TaxID=1524254 RepID=UPI0030EF795E
MKILSFLADAITPVTALIDSMHTSSEEKLMMKAEMLRLQNTVTGQLLDYEAKILDSQAKVIMAEAQGESWLQRSWRPIAMLTFLVLVVCDSFGFLAFRLSDEAWDLLKIGIGGYVVGRSGEKIAPHVKGLFTKETK